MARKKKPARELANEEIANRIFPKEVKQQLKKLAKTETPKRKK